MNTETTTPGGLPSVIKEPSAHSLTEPSEADKVALSLQELAARETDEIGEEFELTRVAKLFDLRLKLIRDKYTRVKTAYWAEKHAAASAPTPEEIEEELRKEKESEEQTAKEDRERQIEATEINADVEYLKKCPDLVPVFLQSLVKAGYQCDLLLAATLLLSHGCRLLPTSTAIFFYGGSGSGKTDGVITAAKFLPEEFVLSITSMSEQALNYLGDIKHKYMMLGEMTPQIDGQDDAKQMILRQLISENKITRVIVERPDGKENTAVTKVTEGPCVITATTTKEPSKFNDELQNRAIWIASNDSAEVTAAVLDAVAQNAANPIVSDRETQRKQRLAWQEFQRTLSPLPVQIPFAMAIKPKNNHVTARRLYKLTLNYVRASALLHQHSRERVRVNGQEAVIATLADYEIAHKVLAGSAPRVLESCSDNSRKFFIEVLQPAFKAQNPPAPLRRDQIARMSTQPASTLYRWLSDYVKEGLLLVDGKSGRQYIYLLNSEVTEFRNQDLGLVHPSELAAHDGWAI